MDFRNLRYRYYAVLYYLYQIRNTFPTCLILSYYPLFKFNTYLVPILASQTAYKSPMMSQTITVSKFTLLYEVGIAPEVGKLLRIVDSVMENVQVGHVTECIINLSEFRQS